jgi:hypothetical protein
MDWLRSFEQGKQAEQKRPSFPLNFAENYQIKISLGQLRVERPFWSLF